MTKPATFSTTRENSLLRLWQQFFHEPVDPRICALIRIGFSALVLVNLAVLCSDRGAWFGEEGVISQGLATKELHERFSDYSWSVLFWLPTSQFVLELCFWVYVAQSVCLLLGWGTRINAVCVFIWLVSFQHRNILLLDGEDTVFRLVGFFLMFMPAGRAWSLDARFRRPGVELPPASGWAVRLMQIQMAVIYLSASLVKMQGETWMDGTALYYVARLDDYFGRFPLPRFMFDVPIVVAVLTWSVILVEFTVPILVWFKETRLPCLFFAVLFHLGCDYTMNLFLFHYIMLVGWMSFVTPDDLDWVASRLRRYLPRSRVSEGPI